MHLRHYLGLLHESLTNLDVACTEVGRAHADEPDVRLDCAKFARRCRHHAETLQPYVRRYGSDTDDEPARLHRVLFDGSRTGPLGLLRDLQDLYLMTSECDISSTMIAQAAQGAGDPDLLGVIQELGAHAAIQLAWIRSRMKQAAPQALVVAR